MNLYNRPMHITLLILVIFGIIAGFMYWNKTTATSNKERVVDERGKSEVSIMLTENGFEPRYVKISQGTEVVFSTTAEKPFWPASNLHPTHDIYSEFDSKGPLQPEETWSFVFENTGAWSFHDHIRSYFNGVIYAE